MSDEPRNDEGKNEDQLWAALDGQVGSERVSTLLELADLVNLRDDYEQGLSLADAAMEAALDTENELLIARAHAMRGATLFALERFEEAAAAHLDAAHLLERYESLTDTSRAYFNASWALEMAGLLERSLQCADSALAVAEQDGDDQPIGAAHTQRADVLEKLGGRGEEVLQALSMARQCFRSAKDAQAVLRIDNRVADIFADGGDFKAAVSLLSDCLAVAESLDEGQAAFFAFRLGYMQRRQGQFAAALATLQRPLEYNLSQDAVHPLAATYFEMAICEWRLNHEDEAFRLMSKARAHYDVIGNDDMVRECDEQRAIWFHGVDKYHEAMALNRQLLEVSTGMARFMARARLADNLRCHLDFEEALEASLPEPDEDPAWIGTSNWFWRECIRAMTLERLDRADEAQQIARDCLDMEISSASAFVQAKFHELWGDSLMDEDEDACHDAWARAVALYLVADALHDARRLSAEFLRDAGDDVQ